MTRPSFRQRAVHQPATPPEYRRARHYDQRCEFELTLGRAERLGRGRIRSGSRRLLDRLTADDFLNLDVDQEAEPERLQEMKREPFFTVEESQANKIAVN